MDHNYVRNNGDDVESEKARNENADPNDSTKSKRWRCQICSASLKFRASLYNHIKRVHHMVPDGRKTIKCLEKDCEEKFAISSHFINHLSTAHNIKIETRQLTFKTMKDFEVWRSEIETKNNVQYVQDTGAHMRKDGSKSFYLRCNRSGTYRDATGGRGRKRKLKSQGTNKIGNHCTSNILVREFPNKESDIQVTYNVDHYGHEIDLAHINLSTLQKNKIAELLKQGLSVDGILDKIKDSITTNIGKIHTITKKNIHRIEKSFGINIIKVEKDKNDLLSVLLWIEENPDIVIYDKRHGTDNPVLVKEDFALGIQTPVMVEMLKKFGNNSLICMDGTHGTKTYDFSLITIVVVDEFGEGFPVAFFYSNKGDEESLKKFLMAVKEKSGNINCTVFMGDEESEYYNAWISVMGGNPMKLLCTWQVDRAWREKLQLIPDPEKQSEVLKLLEVLQYETEESTFLELLPEVQNILYSDPELSDFANYFNTYYANSYQEWAYCGRLNFGIVTDMYVEAMHQTIKHVYSRSLKIKRLDRSIHVLLKMVRDKQFERAMKINQEKNSRKSISFQERHDRAMEFPLSTVKEFSEECWIVSLDENRNSSFKVEKNELIEEDHITCSMKCNECNVCSHMFTCECSDNIIKSELCTHIHLVARFLKEQILRIYSVVKDEESINFDDLMPEEDDEEYVLYKAQTQPKSKAAEAQKREKLAAAFQEIILGLNDVDEETLDIIQEHVTPIRNLLKLKKKVVR